MDQVCHDAERHSRLRRERGVAACSMHWNAYILGEGVFVMERKRCVRMRSIKSGLAKRGVGSEMTGAFFV